MKKSVLKKMLSLLSAVAVMLSLCSIPMQVFAQVGGSAQVSLQINKFGYGDLSIGASSTAAPGDLITVTVAPNQGYSLSGLTLWTTSTPQESRVEPTAISNSFTKIEDNKYTFTVPNVDSATVVAAFAKTAAVSVLSAENGAVTADKSLAAPGEIVTLTVKPNDGYYLSGLELIHGAVSITPPSSVSADFTQSTSNPNEYTFTMSSGGDVTVRAAFTQIPDVFISKDVSAGGQISGLPANARSGASVTFTVTPEEGYYLSGLELKSGTFVSMNFPTSISANFTLAGNSNQYTFTVPFVSTSSPGIAPAVTVRAGFSKKSAVAVRAAVSGTVTSDRSSAAPGETVTLTVTPDKDCYLSGLALEGSSQTSVTPPTSISADFTQSASNPYKYTFTMSNSGDIAVRAAFSAGTIPITVRTQGEGGTLTSSTSMAGPGQPVVLTVTPQEGYSLVDMGLLPNNTGNLQDGIASLFHKISDTPLQYTFTVNVSGISSYPIIARFTKNSTITQSVYGGGSISGLPIWATSGQPVSFLVDPDEGYTLSGLSLSVNSAGSGKPSTIGQEFTQDSLHQNQYTFAMPADAKFLSLTACFSPSDELVLNNNDSLVITDTGYSLNGAAEVPYTKQYALSSATEVNASILVKSGNHKVVLNQLSVKNDTTSPFSIEGTASVLLELNDTTSNEFNTSGDAAALQLAETAALTIQCNHINQTGHSCSAHCGTLNAYNLSGSGAGIGGAKGAAGGTVTIHSGNVSASSYLGAGIGGGSGGAGGVVTINDGYVYAKSTSQLGACIGGGNGGAGGAVTITGGTVYAYGGKGSGDDSNLGASIGGGSGAGGGTTIITGGSLYLSSFSTQPTNGTVPVYKARFQMESQGAYVTGITSFVPGNYGLKTLRTDSGMSSLFFYLPIGPSSFTYQGDAYTATINDQGTAMYQKSTPSATPLAAPTTLAWDGAINGNATWGAVPNASSYAVQLYKDSAALGAAVATTGTSYNFTSTILAAGSGNYAFAVTAVGDGTLYSDSAPSAKSGAYAYIKPTNTYTITASAQAGGSISPSGSVQVNSGESQNFTITPDPGYHIEAVWVDNQNKGAFGSCAFSSVLRDHTITAEFAKDDNGGYSILSGANSSWTPDATGGLTITCSGEFAKFSGIQVDGILVAALNYTAQSGSTILTLKSEYLKTLAAGIHQLRFQYTDGYAETSFTIGASGHMSPQTGADKSPQTDDGSKTLLWVALLLVSSGVLTVFGIHEKKRKQS